MFHRLMLEAEGVTPYTLIIIKDLANANGKRLNNMIIRSHSATVPQCHNRVLDPRHEVCGLVLIVTGEGGVINNRIIKYGVLLLEY